ncbi:MAG: hypothetical protein K0Q72_2076 [Armatimonadetes bacterium]|nr:hypothetical protein [Armatimonadota bacterium]
MKIRVKEHVARQRPWDVVRFVSHLPDFVRLFLRLLGDRRVPFMAKALLISGVVYAVSPLDFLPDLMPLLGQVDDLSIFALACRMFVQLCPRPVVESHVQDIDRTGEWLPFA